MAHALLSPSSAHRWMACTPSARLEENMPDTGSTYAAEGTLAHSLAEVINSYKFKKLTKAQKNKHIKEIEADPLYNAEMLDYIRDFCNFVWEQYNEAKAISKDAIAAFEQRLDMSEYVPECFGTGDVVIVTEGALTIIDLKYGTGVPVSAEYNPQMMLYALGALNEYDVLFGIDTVKMVIYQPRIDNISEWTVDVDYLMRWAEGDLREKADLAFDGAGYFTPGESTCRFCKIKATCRARSKEVLKQLDKMNEDKALMTEEEIAEILKVADWVSNYINDVTAYALDQAVNHGAKFNGWKLVEGRSNRKISDEDKAAEILHAEKYTDADIYNVKLKGITDFEKLLGKKLFNELLGELVIKPQGAPKLALMTDKRPEWQSSASAAADFADVDVSNI